MDTTTSDDGPAPTSPANRTRGRWWRLVAVVPLVLAAVIAAIPWLLSDPARVSRLVARALPELAADVTFSTIRLGWTGPVVLEGVRVVPHDGSTQPLAVARVEVENGLAAILASFGSLGRVRVEGLVADVVFDERRRTNLAGLFRQAAPADGPPGRPRGPVPLRLELAVEDAVVRIAGPWAADPWRSDPIDVRATLGPTSAGGGTAWTIEPVDLLLDARLEPGVAQGVLAYIAPVLAGATRTGGRFSLRIDGAVLPVGRPGDGTLAGTLTLHEVVVGPGPLVGNLITRLPFRLPMPPDVRIADESRVAFRLGERRVWHRGLEFGFPLADSGVRLDIRSEGSVGIDDGGLDLRLRLPIPADLPGDGPVVAALAGKSISVGIGGVLGDPRVVFDGSIRQAAGEFVGDLVDRLRAGSEDPGQPAAVGPSSSGDTAEVIVDAVGQLLQEAARRRAERRAAEEAGGTPGQPRRLRDRLRSRAGPDRGSPPAQP